MDKDKSQERETSNEKNEKVLKVKKLTPLKK